MILKIKIGKHMISVTPAPPLKPRTAYEKAIELMLYRPSPLAIFITRIRSLFHSNFKYIWRKEAAYAALVLNHKPHQYKEVENER